MNDLRAHGCVLRCKQSLRAAVVLLVAGASACKGEEATLGDVAQSLCSYDRAGSPDIAALPTELAKHIRLDDVEFATKKPPTDGGTPSDAGTILVPTTSGSANRATCEVRAVDIQKTTALVKLTRKVDQGATDYAIAFVKTDDGWRADYHLPEKDLARTTASRFYHEGMELVNAYELEKAKEKFVEAQKLAPESENVKKSLAAVDDLLVRRVAGRWTKTVEEDPMTGSQNVFMMLPASADLATRYSNVRPLLSVRCAKGEPDVWINVWAMVEKDYYDGKSKAQYRFNAEPPRWIAMIPSEDRQGLFFPEPTKWFDRLVEHSAGRLIIEVPLYGRIAQAVTFDLAGAEKAIPLVKQACKK